MDNKHIWDLFKNNHKIEVGKTLGKGGFGEVKEIKMNGKIYAAKLVKINAKKDTEKGSFDEGEEKDNIILYLKNSNIVKIYKIYQEIDNSNKNEGYNLIIMERAVLKDLKTFIKYLFSNNRENIICQPYNENIGNHFLIFLAKQIIKGLETFERNELIHFDIKPENILIFLEISLKLSDFGLLREVYNLEKIRIPGGTPGYLSPDYYKYRGHRIPVRNAKKQDYFALGASLYLLKYGERMIKHKIHKSKKKTEENTLNLEYIVEMIPKIIIKIKSDLVADRDFVNFLCSLIQIEAEDRPNFEEIYRNKWVNKNADYISKITKCFGNDEQKLIKELRKSDYLYEKTQELSKIKRRKFVFKINNKKINNKTVFKRNNILK